MTGKTNLAATISFTLALDADQAEVKNVINAINDFFGGATPATAIVGGEPVSDDNANTPVIAPGLDTATLPESNVLGQVDKDGVPWDERIHSSTKGFNKDGTWRAKRGVDEKLFNKVKAELLKTARPMVPVASIGNIDTAEKMAAWRASGMPKIGEMMLDPALFAQPAAAAAAPTVAAAPALPPMPGAAPLPPAPALPPENPAYTALVQFIAANTHSADNPTGRLTPDWIKACLTNYGVEEGSLQNLAHRADLIATVHAGIKTALGL